MKVGARLTVSFIQSFLLVTAVCGRAFPAGNTWYVSNSVSQSGDGASWQNAFKTIQEGINAASHGDTIVVAQATYVENIRFNGKNIVLQSEGPTDPNVVTKTIIDGNQTDSVVVFSGTENESCILSGFTIQNGRGHFDGRYGGGIYGGGTRATIRYNIIAQNRAPST